MKSNLNPKPLLISFRRSVGELRLMGLVAWGGTCVDLEGLRFRDVATRLGAPKLWLETLLETIAQAGTRHVVLVDADFTPFLGNPGEVENRLRIWAANRNVLITRLQTRSQTMMAA